MSKTPLRECPGGCGRDIPATLFACSYCSNSLPVKLRIDLHVIGPEQKYARARALLYWENTRKAGA